MIYKHEEDNIFDACGLDKEVFNKKLFKMNKRMKEEKVDKFSQRVEITEQILTKRELAFFLVHTHEENIELMKANPIFYEMRRRAEETFLSELREEKREKSKDKSKDNTLNYIS